MPGVLPEGSLPDGSDVWVLVDDANSPSGRWRARLSWPSAEGYPRAIIDDPRAPDEWRGREPTVNYTIIADTASVRHLLYALGAADQRLRGHETTIYQLREQIKALVPDGQTAAAVDRLAGVLGEAIADQTERLLAHLTGAR